MNEAPNKTGMNDTFSSQSAPQTNPFTADLKGEFTSNFGTNTNAVSQIFKEGGFVNNNRSKYLIIGGVLAVVAAIVFFVLSEEEDADEFKDETTTEETASTEEKEESSTEEGKEEPKEEMATAPTEDVAPATQPAATEATTAAQPVAEPMGSGPLALAEPMDGASVNYHETHGSATFSWSGGDGYIIFSRSSTMSPEVLKTRASGGSYKFHHPWPGKWYWKVQNATGESEVRSFSVSAPVRRNIQFTAPASAIAGSGGTVSWQGDMNVASYRVEISAGSWANPQYRFATTGNSLQLNGVAAGQYQMRVGAFSEVSGRWEYTAAVPVQIQ